MRRNGTPLLVEITRGDSVESWHEVDAVVVGTDGAVVDSWGDMTRRVLPRSSLKPIQAIPLVATGAASSFALSEVELALACASHDGEPAHVAAVACWLERVGVPVDELACGVHRPMSEAAAIRLAELGRRYTALHNNCSGKHAGFLTLCRHLGIPTDRYFDASHQLQRDHVTPTIEEWCGINLTGQEPAVDGCEIPAWIVPLERLAAGWASMGLERPSSP